MRTRRCKKHQNFIVTETAREHIAHVFEEGEYKFSEHYTGAEFSTILVECKDCGLMETCQKSGMPKWLKEACKEAGIVL
jgi:hypothetical protein